MFTGIVETTGRIIRRDTHKLTVLPDTSFADLVMGESIAVNGCCLTLEHASIGGELVFHTLSQTLTLTNLGSCERVNLERAMPANGRFGGHIVSGHIDCTAPIRKMGKLAGSGGGGSSDMELEIPVSEAFRDFVIPQGSICIDGISLTVAELTADAVKVCLIPTTLDATSLPERFRRRESVNLEFDLIGKYVFNAVRSSAVPGGSGTETQNPVSWNLLKENGFL